MRRRDGGRVGQLHAQRFGQRVHRRGRAHGVAVTGRRRRRRHQLDEALVVDLAGGQKFARLPHDGARTGALPLVPAVQHRADRQGDRRDVDGRRRHQAGRGRLVAADRQHHAVQRITVQNLDQADIGQVAVEAGGRALAGFLDRVNRELDGDAAGFTNALPDAFGQHHVVPVARRQVRTGLGDADDRPVGLQFIQAEAEVHVTLEIERRHVGIVRIVEPGARTQFGI